MNKSASLTPVQGPSTVVCMIVTELSQLTEKKTTYRKRLQKKNSPSGLTRTSPLMRFYTESFGITKC
jgi:hypothetical protein